jgi:hypothetical protein
MQRLLQLITPSPPYGYVTALTFFIDPISLNFTLGRSHGIPVPKPHHRSLPEMEGLLSSIIHPHSVTGTPGYLLARNTYHPRPDRSRAKTCGLLGSDRQLHLLLSCRPIMGHEQSLVGIQ